MGNSRRHAGRIGKTPNSAKRNEKIARRKETQPERIEARQNAGDNGLDIKSIFTSDNFDRVRLSRLGYTKKQIDEYMSRDEAPVVDATPEETDGEFQPCSGCGTDCELDCPKNDNE